MNLSKNFAEKELAGLTVSLIELYDDESVLVVIYLKNLYVHFIKKIFLAWSANALSNKLRESGVSRSPNASGVFPCDQTKYNSEPALYSQRTTRFDLN